MMPLISLADGLAHARQHRYALGAFNVLDSHFLRALFAAAKQERSPFIINIAEVHFKYVSLDSLVEAVKFEAARHAIPVVLNLDHGLHYDAVVRALRLGFSSVMFDGSTLSYEENVRQTREVVKMCHAVGVSVEAELGIHKINFYTGMSQAALAAVEQRMANRQPLYDEFAELLLGIEEAINDTVAEQMRIFGSAGQA